MNPLLFNNMPPFIKKEMEKITEQIQPLMKKNSKYVMFAFPLMLVGGINLLILFIQNTWSLDMVTGIYALMTAIGLALYKESKHMNKRIHQIGKEHMIERIKTSRIIADEKKKAYVKLVKEQSKMSLQTFFNFLNEENKERQNLYS
ncbi:hypothetical protein GCM10011351_02090 [Paraliobacillus quinghaiensis]|uniref:DUF5392 family protein n=1 Tax=Paraliobacillus quinghaiensis TaxID=470815 RepID=A0A917WNX3_9BACI|nr:DUF5392 family protein [Paraliobacillus quinghaiensis]GGM19809.1 hypothetical protein GCM10011351_02090 [Paraliobacillus quinghaiensis]